MGTKSDEKGTKQSKSPQSPLRTKHSRLKAASRQKHDGDSDDSDSWMQVRRTKPKMIRLTKPTGSHKADDKVEESSQSQVAGEGSEESAPPPVAEEEEVVSSKTEDDSTLRQADDGPSPHVRFAVEENQSNYNLDMSAIASKAAILGTTPPSISGVARGRSNQTTNTESDNKPKNAEEPKKRKEKRKKSFDMNQFLEKTKKMCWL